MLRVAADHFADSDTGRQRRNNEDVFYARAPLFAIADGMGGAQAGEIASRTAVDVLARGVGGDGGSVEERLARLVQEANVRVHQLSTSDERLAGMGTTLTIAYVGDDEVTIAHVGDSRMYRLRDGQLEKLTNDHSLVDEYVRQGRLTPEEAGHHPQRSIVTRAIGPEDHVDVDTCTARARDGDVFLLCSDGLTDMVGERDLEATLLEARSLREAGRELIARANEAGGKDNITIVLFRLEEVGGAAAAPEAETTEHDALATRVRAGGGATAVASVPATAPAAPRAPRAPGDDPPPAARPRGRARIPGGLVASLVVIGALLLAGFYASQTVYFVGASDTGVVAVFRGMPWDLPGGLDLYSVVYESGVPAQEAPGGLVGEHDLRSRDDAYAVVRALERGEAVPQ